MGAFGTVRIPDAAGLRLTTYAAGGCFRAGSQLAVSTSIVLIGKGALNGTDQAPIHLEYRNNAGTYELLAGFVEAGTLTVRSASAAYTFTVSRRGAWYDAIVTYDNATWALRVYARLRGTRADPASATLTTVISTTLAGAAAPAAGTAPLTLASGGVANGWSASECFLYSSAVSKATLEGRLGTRLTGQESTLVGCWPLDDGRDAYTSSGNAVAWDISGNGRNGVLLEHADWTDDPADLLYSTGVFPYAVLGYFPVNRLRDLTLAVTDEASADYGGKFLRNALQVKAWRSLNATGNKDATFTLYRPMSVGAITLDGLNLSSQATITATFYGTGGPTDSTAYAVQLRRHPKRVREILPIPVGYPYLRVRFNDPASTDGYLNVGTCCPWVTFEPSRDSALRPPLALMDASTAQDGPHFFRVGRNLPIAESEAFNFADLRTGEAFELMRICRTIGGGQPVWACEDPGRNLYTRSPYGYLAGLPTLTIGARSPVFASVGPLVVMEDRAARAA